MTRKAGLFSLFFLASFFLLAPSPCAFARDASAPTPAPRTLPDVPGWICGELRTTDLDTVSGNQGVWLQRDYRAASGVRLRATLMMGKGAGTLRFPPGIRAEDGPLGSGCTYRTLEMAGLCVAVETHPILGISATARLGNGYLTLESGDYALSSEDTVSAIERFLSTI